MAFGAGNAASFYLCHLTSSTSSNCVAAGSGSYTLVNGIDASTPLLTFSGLPAAAATQSYTRVFVRRNSLSGMASSPSSTR